MLRRDGYYVLADLGLVACLETDNKPGPSSRTGSRGYWAPEVVRREPQAASADWWSLGVTLLYAALGSHPFRVRSAHVEYPEAPAPAPVQATTIAGSKARADGGDPGGVELMPATAVADPRGNGVAAAAPEEQAAKVDGSRVKLTEDELNANTLLLPLVPGDWDIDSQLALLIHGLLQRNVGDRLGTVGGAAEIKQHPLFAGIEWQLLCDGKLPAPFLPDPTLVYAKDHVPPLSEDSPAAVAAAQAPPRARLEPTVEAAELVDPPLTPAPGSAEQAAPSAARQAAQHRAAAVGAVQAPPATDAQVEAPSETFLQIWDFVSGSEAFSTELRELVRKTPDGDSLWS